MSCFLLGSKKELKEDFMVVMGELVQIKETWQYRLESFASF